MKTRKSIALAALVGCIGIAPMAQAQDPVRDNARADTRDTVSDRTRDGSSDGLRLRCGSVGAGDISMRSRYAVRSRHRGISFAAGFVAAPEGNYHAGDRLEVILAGIRVGAVLLERRDDGDLVGVLELQQGTDLDAATTDVNLHRLRVREGTSVVVGPLGCALDR